MGVGGSCGVQVRPMGPVSVWYAVTVTIPRVPVRFTSGPIFSFSSFAWISLCSAVGSTTTVWSGVRQMMTSARWPQSAAQYDQWVATGFEFGALPTRMTSWKLVLLAVLSNGITSVPDGSV